MSAPPPIELPGAARHSVLSVALVACLALSACGGDAAIDRPQPLYGEDPVEYPLSLWDAGVEGETLLRVRVTDVGVVDSIEVVESSGHPGLDSAAVNGVRDLQFEPGRRDGERVRMWATLPIVFSKRPEAERNPLGSMDE